MECALGDLFCGHSRVLVFLCFAGTDVEVGDIASAYRRKLLNHILRILSRYIILNLFLFIIVFHRLCAWI